MKKIVVITIIILLLICSSYKVVSIYAYKQKTRSNDYILWAVLISAGEPQRDLKNIDELKNILLANGWDEYNIYLFSEEEATKQKILEIPQLLENNGLKEEDLVLFYFSMHGGYTEDIEPLDEPDGIDEFIISFNNEKIFDEELGFAFNNVVSENILFIFETCYSGGMIDGANDLIKSGRIIITSAGNNETSYPIFLQKSWLFPFYLIKGLKGFADQNNDNFISAEEVYSYAEKRTIIRSTIYGCLFYIFHKSIFIQHPQMFDGWPSKENNTQDLILINL
jgi:hypothetical protein